MLALLSSAIATLLLSFGSFRLAKSLAAPDAIAFFPRSSRYSNLKPQHRLFSREVKLLRWFSFVCWLYSMQTTLFVGIWLMFQQLLPPSFQVYTPVAIVVAFLFSVPGISLIKNLPYLKNKPVRQRIYIATAITVWVSLFLGSFTLMSALEPDHPIMMSVDWITQPLYMAIAAILLSLLHSIYWPFYGSRRRRKRRKRSSRSHTVGGSTNFDSGDG